MSTPAGWYTSPEDPSQQRYWDGTAWTDHYAPIEPPEPTVIMPPIAPAPPPPPPPPAPGYAAPSPAPTQMEPWYKKRWVWGVAAAIVVVGVISSLTNKNDADPAADKPSAVVTVTQPAAPAATVTVEATPTREASEEPESVVGNNDPAENGFFVMPDERGKNLQASQDDLQAITGNPFFYTSSEDATGDSRFQILDSGWQVCSQKPAPGKRLSVDYSDIIFYVVRNSETCP